MKKELIIGIVVIVIGAIAVGAFFINKQSEYAFSGPCIVSEKPFELNSDLVLVRSTLVRFLTRTSIL